MADRNFIPVAAPTLGGNERAYVLECLDSTWISSSGRFLDAFEADFARFCGVSHAVAVNNGTTALHLALTALGIGPGDEVIVPNLTYIASANAVTYCGAKPVFVDCEPLTLNLDPDCIEARITPRTRAIMPVHLYGHPADMDRIIRLAARHDLHVVEDAAEAHGATYRGRPVGSFGACATFSFYGNKIITTGEGGMVVTDDSALAARLRLYRGQGLDPQRRYIHPVVGFNYRMTNIAAAIGLAQLERINTILAARRQVAAWYAERLAGIEGLRLLGSQPWAAPVPWLVTVLLTGGRCPRAGRSHGGAPGRRHRQPSNLLSNAPAGPLSRGDSLSCRRDVVGPWTQPADLRGHDRGRCRGGLRILEAGHRPICRRVPRRITA